MHKGSNKPAAPNPAIASLFQAGRHWTGLAALDVTPTRTRTTMRTVQRTKRNAGHLLLLLCFGVCSATRAQDPPTIVWQSKATNSYISNPVALSPDGSVVATLGTNNSVQIWRMSNGVPLIALSGHSSWIGDLAFSPDGAYLASGGGDSSVRVWRTADWSLVYSIASGSQGPPVAFSPDSATLAIGDGTTIELRRATNGAVFQSWPATSGWWMNIMSTHAGVFRRVCEFHSGRERHCTRTLWMLCSLSRPWGGIGWSRSSADFTASHSSWADDYSMGRRDGTLPIAACFAAWQRLAGRGWRFDHELGRHHTQQFKRFLPRDCVATVVVKSEDLPSF